LKLIDVACPKCGQVTVDVFVQTLEPALFPYCQCGAQVERAWAFVKAPGITPQGTRPERNTDKPVGPQRVDTKAIAEETKFEVEQKWLRYSDEKVAEQHVSREINHKAGIADEAGNEIPVPKPAPITFPKPSLAECAV
jgi:hypothetical protein